MHVLFHMQSAYLWHLNFVLLSETPQSGDSTSDGSSSGDLSIAVIGGIIGGVVVAIVIIILLVVVIVCMRRLRSKQTGIMK